MRTIVIYSDSLNRHYLNAYGCDFIKTPNIDRLAEKSMVFQKHYSGSLPCMPARRDLWTGKLSLLESPWCPIQAYDITMPDILRDQKNIYSHLISDHYHYWETNGTGYNTVYDSWEFPRGQECDQWKTIAKPLNLDNIRGRGIGAKNRYLANGRIRNATNREFIDKEDENQYPTVQCFKLAQEFLDVNNENDNWHLHVEVFDPHEPFMCPKKYSDMYNDVWEKDFEFDWPEYKPVNMEIEGQEAVNHIRSLYAGCVTMLDKHLGELFDKMDKYDMWKDTTVILSSDHGHLLGEHDYWAKNYMFDYEELVHIPLIIYYPNAKNNGKKINELTSVVDVMPTILEMHGCKAEHEIHGKSIMPMFEKEQKIRDYAMYGYFAKDVSITDGKMTYTRQPLADSHCYSYLSQIFGYGKGDENYENAEMGKFLKGVDIPVYKIKRKSYRHHNSPEVNLIYDIENDPQQQHNIVDEKLESKFAEKMVEMLLEYNAPECQYERLNLTVKTK